MPSESFLSFVPFMLFLFRLLESQSHLGVPQGAMRPTEPQDRAPIARLLDLRDACP